MKNKQSIRSKQFIWRRVLLLTLLLGLLGSVTQPAAASCGGTTNVSTESELNSAIADYNAVAAGPCVFTIQLTADINLGASTTGIQNSTTNVSLVIQGAGYTVNGQNTSGVRPFKLMASNTKPVTFNQITITGGYVPGEPGGGIEVQNGHLTVTNSTITGNRADTGGGISICSLTDCGLTLQNSTISGNTADSSFGGGILAGGSVIIDSSTIVDNTACNGCGGALGVTSGNATVTNSILANSAGAVPDCRTLSPGTVTDGGYNLVETPGSCSFTATGSITGPDPMVGPLANNGGPTQTHALLTGSPAINAGSTTLTTDQRGVARPSGAADDIGAFELGTPQSGPNFVVTVSTDTDDGRCESSPGHCTLREAINAANALSGADTITFNIPMMAGCTAINTCTITLGSNLPDITTDVTINGAPNNGHITIDGASAHRLFAAESGTLTLQNLTLSNGGPPQIMGGGAAIRISNSSTVNVDNCTFTGNHAASNAGGAILNNGTLNVTNSTFYNNSATLNGGAIWNIGTLNVTNSTFSDNSGSNGGGIFNAGTATLKNTIIANSTSGGDCYNLNTVNGNNNLIKDSSNACGLTNGSNGNIVGTDPNLAALANNGGPTQTMALNTGSAAINAGSNTDCAAAPVNNLDQRNYVRPADTTCDIGAFEYNAPTAVNLVGFGARYNAKQNRVTVKWQTGSELNIVGFNLYRAPSKNGTYKQLNAELVPAKQMGQVQGDTYRFTDKTVKVGKTYSYKLQVLYADGTREWSELKRVRTP